MRTGMLSIESESASDAVTKIDEENGPAYATWTIACLEHVVEVLTFTESISGAEEAHW